MDPSIITVHNINVSMLQFQQGTKSTRFAQEVKARKRKEENSRIEPFRSHRKHQNQDNVLKPIYQNNLININHDPQAFKLSRQYPPEPISASLPLSKIKTQRFKYDLTELPQSLSKQEITSKYTQKINDSESHLFASKYCTIIKKYPNSEEIFTINRIQRNEVKSIIFDSKVKPFDCKFSTPNPKEIERQNDREINMLKQKVDKVNNEIAEGISKLEKLIETIKQQKVRQSTTVGQLVQTKKQRTENIHQFEEFSQKDLEGKVHKRATFFKKRQSPILIKQEEVIQKENKQEEIQNSIHLPIKEVKNQCLTTSESQSELAGGFKNKLSKFPQEYNSFVNRLSYQIQIDMQFTNLIYELSRNRQLPKVKDLIFNEIKKYQPEVDMNESFFQIEPSQIDPLQLSKPQFILNNNQEKDQALKVFNKYKQIQGHFDNKLRGKFGSNIIILFFEELSKFNCNKMMEESSSATTGHLLSYLNMRTNKSYRNRFFVKISKRLGLKPNTNLVPDSFRIIIAS